MRVPLRAAGACSFVLALLLALFAGPAAAQTTGKIEGRVTDAQTGQPLAGAQVVVVGTTLGNLTNQDGYYFINNVPVGIHDVQAQYIGYQSVTVAAQRVLAGQTMTVNFELPTQAVALEAITVIGETNPLVPRDKTVSKAIVTGDVVQQLPVNRIDEVVALQPGVISFGGQFVVRGGRPGEASVYVDGVLVRNFNLGNQGFVDLGTNAVEEVNVLLGGYGAEYGQAQSGIVNYITRAGGQDYSGALNFSTDEVMPNDMRWGQSRLEASVGGPLFGGATFHLAGTFEGNEDGGPRFTDGILGADSIPLQRVFFRPTGMTTTAFADGKTIDHMGYEVIEGLGNRVPYNNDDFFSTSGTVRYSPFDWTTLSLGTVISRDQGLAFSETWQFRPKAISAFRNKSQLFRAGLEQILLQSAERQATLKLNVAYQNDTRVAGQRADTTSLEPEGADFLGFRISGYEFLFEDACTVDAYMARHAAVLSAQEQNPLLCVETIGMTPEAGVEAFDPQDSNDNPYGYLKFNGRGLADHYFAQEKTLSFDADLDFQVNRVHRVGAGVEIYRKRVDNLTSTGGGQMAVEDTYFHNVYRVEPLIAGAYLKDRMDIGEMVIDAGVRFDLFDSDAVYPVIPGLVYPFEPDGPNDYRCAAQITETLCAPKTVEQERIWSVSPRLGVAFPISDVTNFRLSYGHFFQLPDFNELFNAINTDISRSNTNTLFGRPIDAMRAVQFEAGLSHMFSPYTVLDVTAYNKDKLADAAYRIQLIDWPAARRGPQDARILTNLDFGNTKGVDVRLTRRYAEYFTAILGYSYLQAKGTGSDPGTYVFSFGRFADPITGAPLSPAQAMQPNDFDRTHQFTIASTANLGGDFAEGSGWNSLLRNTNVAVTLTAGSGLPYTRSSTPGARGRGATGARYTELLNASRLPWTYEVDARLTRGFQVGGSRIAAFLDARNLLNTRNQTNIFGYEKVVSPVDPGDIANQTSGVAGNVTLANVADPGTRLAYTRQQDLLAMYGLADDNPDVVSALEQRRLQGLRYIHNLDLENNFGPPRRMRVGLEWVF